MLDIKIVGGKIYNGTLSPASLGDVGIRMDRIEAVGDLSSRDAHETIDAAGLAVAPGFIDIHSHSDFTVLVNPLSESKVRQGVTTEVIGNCGSSAAPLYGPCLEHIKDSNKEYNIGIDWNDLDGYADRLRKSGSSVNLAPLIGHGNIRASVIGYEKRAPTKGEMTRMKELLRDAMRQGAYGLSTGLIYPPGTFATTDELAELAKVLEEFQGIYATHMRSEGNGLVEAVTEAIFIGESANIPVQISHLKTAGKQNWGKISEVFQLIERAVKRGVEVTVDRYPYIASSTDLDAILPSWMYEGGNEKELERLKDTAILERLSAEFKKMTDEDWQRMMVATVSTDANRDCEGLTVGEIARLRKKEPFTAVVDLLVEERLKVAAVFFGMCEENLRSVLRKPYAMVGSDGSSKAHYGPLASGKPHPRCYGTFARVLGQYVRENVVTLEEAVHKMTQMPARKIGIQKRGVIEQGMFADIVVFDPRTVADVATYQQPHQYPAGIRTVIVGGEAVVRDGRHTGAMPGRLLKKSIG